MPKLPTNISGKDAIKVFQKDGWFISRYGPHIIMEKEGIRPILAIPNHKVLAPGTLRSLIRYSGLTREKFCQLLK
ncbi:MAG TPA: addiction module toxin, HicA family [Candidatus Omnitrophica bacterium]|nr:addiction module toxin, HicA family [Candidatus Omnitrophota bacterium]